MEYTNIEDVLHDFVKSYEDLKQLRNDLTTVLHGRVLIVNDNDASDIAQKVLSDADYSQALSKAMKARDPLSTLKIFETLIADLDCSIIAKGKTMDKLKERILLQGSCHETKIAEKKLKSLRNDVEILNKRMEDCVCKFYKLRKGIIDKVVGLSRSVTSTFCSVPNQMVAGYIKRYNINTVALESCDGGLKGE